MRDSAYASEYTRLWHLTLGAHVAAEARAVSPDGTDVTAVVWGPDSRQIAFSGKPAPTLVADAQGAVYVQSEPGAESRKVTMMPGSEQVAGWPADLGLIIAASGENYGTANTKLWLVSLTAAEPVSLTDALDEDASFVGGSAKELWVEAAAKTGRALFRITLAEGKAAGAPQRVSGDRFNSGFAAAGTTVAFLSESASEPPDVFVSVGASFTPRRLTTTNPQAASFVHGAQRVVTWKSSSDSESIEGVLTLPPTYQNGTRCRWRWWCTAARRCVVGAVHVAHGRLSGAGLRQSGIRGAPAKLSWLNRIRAAIPRPQSRRHPREGLDRRELGRGCDDPTGIATPRGWD